jgi:hypothetical protein
MAESQAAYQVANRFFHPSLSRMGNLAGKRWWLEATPKKLDQSDL